MTMYMMTEQKHAQLIAAYTEGDWNDMEQALAMLKAMKPVEPSAWMHLTEDGNIRMWSKSSPETIESAIGVKPQALYAKEQQ